MASDLEDLISQGFLTVNPTPSERFVACPLCLRAFTRRALESKLLTEEHVPAEVLGGKPRTLTCHECNNHHGSRYEGQIVQLMKYDSFGELLPQSEAESSLEFDGNKLNVLAKYLGDDVFRFDFDSRKSPNNGIQELISLNVGEQIPNIKFTPKRKFHHRRSDLGLLRIAYLEAFISFGYKYIFHENLELIRKQLEKPELNLIPDCGVIDKNTSSDIPRLGLVMEPQHLQSFLVTIDAKLKTGINFRYGVLLPLQKPGGLEIYQFSKTYNQTQNWPQLLIRPYLSAGEN